MSLNIAQALPRHQVDFSTAKVGHSLDISAVNSHGQPVLYTFRDKWPTPYNQHALSKLAANIATKRDAGQAVHIYCVGDSLIDQTYGYPKTLRRVWQSLPGDAGMGTTGLTSLWEWKTGITNDSGTWTTEQPDVAVNDEKRLALIRWIKVDAAGGGQTTINFAAAGVEGTFDSMTLYVQEGSTCSTAMTVTTLTSDGATVATNTYDLTAGLSGNNYRKITLTGFGWNGTARKLRISSTAASGRVALLGATYTRTCTTGGVQVHSMASGGEQLQQIAVLNATVQADVLSAKVPDLVIIEGGINDAIQGNPSTSDYVSWLTTIITRYRTANANCAILLMSPIYASDYQYATQMGFVEAAMQSLADAYNCAWMKYSDILGPYAEANANGLMSDSVHPSGEGHKLIAAALLDIVGPQMQQLAITTHGTRGPTVDIVATAIGDLDTPVGITTSRTTSSLTIQNKTADLPAVTIKQKSGNTNAGYALNLRNTADTADLFNITYAGRCNTFGTSSGSVVWAGYVGGETKPRILLRPGSLSFGDGTSTNPDSRLQWVSAGVLQFDNFGSGGITLQFPSGTVFSAGTGGNGLKIGSATNQLIGFFNATPIVQPSGTTDLRTALINLGLYASGGATPLDLNGGAFNAASATVTGDFSGNGLSLSGDRSSAAWTTTGIGLRIAAATYTDTSSSGTVASMCVHNIGAPTVAASSSTTYTVGSTLRIAGAPINGSNVTITKKYTLEIASGSVLIGDSVNFVFSTSTGTKLGLSPGQKLGLWNKTPIVQPAGAAQAAITNATGGTAGSSLVDVGATPTQANINNNFATLWTLVDAMRTAMVNFGSMKGSA